MGKSGIEWKCGNCNKEYTNKEFTKLCTKEGIVCPCGYRFLKDRWMLKTEITFYRKILWIRFPTMKALVSTVFLELNHSGFWYETMIFGKNLDEYQRRYVTREEAIKGHNSIVARLRKVAGDKNG